MMSRHSEDSLENWRRSWRKNFATPDAFLRHLDQKPTAKLGLIDEPLFLSRLPQPYVPDNWQDLDFMWDFVKERQLRGLLVKKTPLTVARNQDLAEVWVGLTLPLSKWNQVTCPLAFITPQFMATQPELAKIKTPRGANRYCFLINSAQAVGILAKHNPTAAQTWQQQHPDWQEPGRVLVFNGGCGAVVNLN